MATYENRDSHARTWTHLVNPATERTLELAPGEQADLDLPADFIDLYLKPVAAKAKGNTHSKAAEAEPESKE